MILFLGVPAHLHSGTVSIFFSRRRAVHSIFFWHLNPIPKKRLGCQKKDAASIAHADLVRRLTFDV